MKQHILVLAKGLLMGTAEILPGISGSTIALITGIYEDFIGLINSITDLLRTCVLLGLRRSSKKDFLSSLRRVNWKFAIYLFGGMLVAILGLSSLLHGILKVYPIYLNAFLFGLILASIYMPLKRIKHRSKAIFIVLIITAVSVFLVLGMSGNSFEADPSLLKFFIGGFFAASAFTLPGVSGSFILLLFGLYYSILEMIAKFSRGDMSSGLILQMSVFFAGIIIGLIVMSRIIGWALDRYHDLTMAFLVGLMLGSLRILYPFRGEGTNPWISVSLIIAGILLVSSMILAPYFLNRKQRHKR